MQLKRIQCASDVLSNSAVRTVRPTVDITDNATQQFPLDTASNKSSLSSTLLSSDIRTLGLPTLHHQNKVHYNDMSDIATDLCYQC